MINFFRSNKKRDFIAYWDLTKFEELLSKGIEVGSDYFFLIKCIENTSPQAKIHQLLPKFSFIPISTA